MGRRKIEIKAIKDDRNRSVTFLKRKGGLFKKAHELSVLCSVDVAVIIFGNNKKLYEYSSGDIGEILTRYQYYGGANEHKGPADFIGKGKDDGSDDDDDGSPPSLHGSVEPPQMMPPQYSHQQQFHRMRHVTPSASPPIPNGVFSNPHQRQHTPQPGMGSRPSSRNQIRRPSSLVPQQPQPPNGHYAYAPNPPPYNPHGQMTPGLPPHPHGMPQHMQGPPQGIPHPHQSPQPQYGHFPSPQQHPQQIPQHPQHQQHIPLHPQQQHPQQHPQQMPQHPQQISQHPQQQHPQQAHPQQVQQLYAEEQRRSSLPPTFPPQERPPSRPTPSPPQPPQQQIIQPPPPQQQQQQTSSPEQKHQMLEPIKRTSIKSRSIFTPIDESRSMLSQIWASSSSNSETIKPDPGTQTHTAEVQVTRIKHPSPPQPQPQRIQTHNKNRNISLSSVDSFTPPSRTNSAQLSAGGGKRPVLKVQIPEEASDNGGSATAEDLSSPRSANASGSTARRNGGDHAGMVLPPPSPSASALLSAGATGPPNPFARPHPVTQSSQSTNASGSNNNNSSNNNMIDTPVSALPSRFMTTEFLPSPSSFYPEWNFRGSDSNTLPSPLNFATPVVGTGPSFLRDDNGGDRNGKRKTPEQDGDRDGGDSKRPKLDG